MNIGEAMKERILELCRERNISVNKLSILSGITQSTINNIVSGRNHSTTISTIKKLCAGLDISIEDFSIPNYFGIWSRKSNKKVGILRLQPFSYSHLTAVPEAVTISIPLSAPKTS